MTTLSPSAQIAPEMPRDLYGGILAGGFSRRFGQDKASFLLDGVTLLERQIALLRELRPRKLLVSCRREQDLRASEGVALIHDEKENCGPMEGLRRLLSHLPASSRVLVVAVDMPSLTVPFLRRLVQIAPAGKGVIPRHENRYEPLCAVYSTDTKPLLEELMARGQFALQGLAEKCVRHGLSDIHEISREELIFFKNLNTSPPGQDNLLD